MSEALFLSLKLSFLTTLILLSISVPLSYTLAFLKVPFKGLLEALFISPILIPPTVLGFYLLYILSPESFIGKAIEKLLGKSILFSFEALLIASVIYSLPFGIFPIRDSFERIPGRYIEIAYVFGYSKLETFFKVILPNSWGGILTASALVFAHTMGEFGVVLMVGGNIPGETRTLSILIYDEVQAINYRDAHIASLILLAVSMLALGIFISMRRRWVRLS